MRIKLRKIWRQWNLLREITNDFWQAKETTLKQKFWAYKRGFFSSSIIMYSLNDENYSEYLSDFAYIKLQPINGYYSKWIDDKLTIKYMLRPYDQYLPSYYYQLANKENKVIVTRLMDCPAEYGSEIADTVRLLEAEGCLAVKLIAGLHGDGFYKIAYRENEYYINDMPVTKSDLIVFLQKLSGYILTEYLLGHQDFSVICRNCPSSLRITTIKEADARPQIIGAFMKFGTQESGSVDNVSAGGVAAVVDLDSGYFNRGSIYIKPGWVQSPMHPDTKMPVEGTVPFWNQIIATVLSICDYLPQMKLMGFDIMITDNGFKIIEINSRPAIDMHYYFSPAYTNDKCRGFFKNL